MASGALAGSCGCLAAVVDHVSRTFLFCTSEAKVDPDVFRRASAALLEAKHLLP